MLPRQVLAPFQIRAYRFQWPADLLTSWAFEMETLILGWFILVETRSVLLLTLFGAMFFLGTLISPMLGVIGDRIGHRTLLTSMRVVYALLAAVLMSLAFASMLSPTHVFVIAFLVGLVRPSDLGVRGALIAATMQNDRLIGAMSISRTTSDSARIVGALAGAGMFVAFGMGPAYVVIAALYVLGAALTLGVTPESRQHHHDPGVQGASRPSHWSDLKEGLVYVWSTPRLRAMIWIAFLANLTAFPLLIGLMPYIAKEVYRVDETVLGYLVASQAAGALIGSIMLSTAGDRIRLERVIMISMIGWYLVLLVFANVDHIAVGFACLVLTGLAQSLSMTPLSVLLMRGSSAQFRGRVMGVRMLAIYGLPVGLLGSGALIEWIGYAATSTVYAAVGLLATVAIMVRWRTDVWHVVEMPLVPAAPQSGKLGV